VQEPVGGQHENVESSFSEAELGLDMSLGRDLPELQGQGQVSDADRGSLAWMPLAENNSGVRESFDHELSVEQGGLDVDDGNMTTGNQDEEEVDDDDDDLSQLDSKLFEDEERTLRQQKEKTPKGQGTKVAQPRVGIHL